MRTEMHRTFILSAMMALLTALSPMPAAAQSLYRPVAVVNDSAITGYDIQQRARLMTVLGFRAASQQALRQAALQGLVDDRLKLQAGRQQGLAPNDDIAAAGVAALAERIGSEEDALRVLLRNQGVGPQALNDFVTADVIWSEVVRSRFARRVEPGEAEINAEIALAAGGGQLSYKVQEIGIPASEPGRDEAQTRDLVERIYADLASGGSFEDAVRLYSRAPSAASGGEVGWVSARSLPPDVADALARAPLGEVTRPLPVPGGFSILRATDRRTEGDGALDPDDPELRERVRGMIIERQSARLAEGLLQELRRDAMIDIRQ